MEKEIFIREMRQNGPHGFTIEWTDGKLLQYRLSELQRACPCAVCRGSAAVAQVDEEVRAVRIASVGRYALQIFFTKGCSKGIYPFSLLRKLGKRHEA